MKSAVLRYTRATPGGLCHVYRRSSPHTYDYIHGTEKTKGCSKIPPGPKLGYRWV